MGLDSYTGMEHYLTKGRNKENRPAPDKPNTRIIRTGSDHIGIKLHKTFIVTYFKDGRIKLNTSGWKTVTTRDRMNCFQSHFNISQAKFIWYLDYQSKEYLYEDGMVLYPNGKIESGMGKPIKPFTKSALKKVNKLKAKVDKYCDTFIEKFFNHKIPQPSKGDCWDCCLFTSDSSNGDHIFSNSNDGGHIMSHIKEKYYVPSLLNNAINEAESGTYGLAPIDKHNIAYYWKMDGWETNNPIMIDITKKRLKMVLKRYVHKRAGLGVT